MMMLESIYTILLPHNQHMDVRAGCTVAAQSTQGRHMTFRAESIVGILL